MKYIKYAKKYIKYAKTALFAILIENFSKLWHDKTIC